MDNFYKGKNVLITGGGGFIGSALAKRLRGLGANIRITGHYKDSSLKPFVAKWQDGEAIVYPCDLTCAKDCQVICDGIDYVFHCAAETSGAAVIENTPLIHLTPNVIMNSLMLQAAYEAKVKKFLFISSSVVYPDISEWPMRETDVTDEFFPKYYIVAWMKRFTEIMCNMYSTKAKNPMSTVIVRPSNVYGPGDNFDSETSHVIPSLIRKVVERQNPIVVWGDGQDKKDFIYIDDFIDGLLLAMEKLDNAEVVNIASGNQYVIRKVFMVIFAEVYAKEIILYGQSPFVKVEYDESKPTMIPARLISINKAKKLLGFEPKVSIEEGLRRTIEWYKQTK